MIVYFIIMCMVILLSLRNGNDSNKYKEKIMLCILIFISGTRYNLGGSDYELYQIGYEAVPNLVTFLPHAFSGLGEYNYWGWESGYMLLNSFCKTLGLSFHGFLLIHSIIFYTLMYIGLRKYISNFNFLLIVFMYKYFFYETFVAMRQSLTIAMFFYSLKYIENGNWKMYFSLSFLAFMFHRGAILLFPIYFIREVKLTKRKILWLNLIFIPTLVLSFLHIPVLDNLNFILGFVDNPTFAGKAERLMNADLSGGISIFHVLEFFLVMMLVYVNYDKFNPNDKKIDLAIKLFLCLLPFFTLLRGYSILTREKDYFVIMYAPILYYIAKHKVSQHRLIFALTTAICVFGFFRFIILFDNGGMMPYKSWLFQSNATLFLNEF